LFDKPYELTGVSANPDTTPHRGVSEHDRRSASLAIRSRKKVAALFKEPCGGRGRSRTAPYAESEDAAARFTTPKTMTPCPPSGAARPGYRLLRLSGENDAASFLCKTLAVQDLAFGLAGVRDEFSAPSINRAAVVSTRLAAGVRAGVLAVGGGGRWTNGQNCNRCANVLRPGTSNQGMNLRARRQRVAVSNSITPSSEPQPGQRVTMR
jgi:hypothetical protein